MSWAIELFHNGGYLMYVNLVVLVFALAVISERAFMLFARFRVNTKAFLLEIEKALGAGNMPKAVKMCKEEEQKGKLLPKMVLVAINSFQLGTIEAWERAIDESKAELVPLITKRLGMLWPLANIATLVGLVGTVFGLIEAFSAVGAVSAEQKALLLTKGISHAMNNTAWGLSIALVITLAHMILNNYMKGLADDLELASHRMINILAKHHMAERAKAAAAGQQQA